MVAYLQALLGVPGAVATEVQDAAQDVHGASGGGGDGVLRGLCMCICVCVDEQKWCIYC